MRSRISLEVIKLVIRPINKNIQKVVIKEKKKESSSSGVLEGGRLKIKRVTCLEEEVEPYQSDEGEGGEGQGVDNDDEVIDRAIFVIVRRYLILI